MVHNDGANQGSGSAQRMFGPQAGVYATSQVHVRDDSLNVLQRLAAQPDSKPYGWAADLGTGAGFTAFAMTQCSDRVVATDPTRPMLEQARRLGQERGLENLRLSRNVAESLPFASDCLDLVTSRVAGHHFSDLNLAFDEVRRVLKPGGVFVMADSVCPEDDVVDRWMNDIELRRDFSHVRNRKISEINGMLAARGLDVQAQEGARIFLKFNEWVARTVVPEPEATNLRNDFLAASAGAREAFQIEPSGDDIDFSWPCLVFRAVKA